MLQAGRDVEDGVRVSLVQEPFEGYADAPSSVAAEHAALGVVLAGRGDAAAAIVEYGKAIEVLAAGSRDGVGVDDGILLAKCLANRGIAFRLRGNLDASAEDLGKSIAIYERIVNMEGTGEHGALAGELAQCLRHRSTTLREQGKLDEAAGEIERAIGMQTRLVDKDGQGGPATDLARFLSDRAHLLRLQGRLGEAVGELAKAIDIRSRLIGEEWNNELAGELAVSHNLRGMALRILGDSGGAVADFEKAIEIRSRLFEQEGREALAVPLAGSLSSAAWVYATSVDDTVRNGERSEAYARRACELGQWRSHVSLMALAAAAAEKGSYADAVKWQESAIEQAPDEAREELRAALELYRSGQPCREHPTGSVPGG